MKNNITNIIVEEIHKLYEDPKILQENPDGMIVNPNNDEYEKEIRFFDYDAVAFIYVDGILLADKAITHKNLIEDALYNNIIQMPDEANYYINLAKIKYADFPDKIELTKRHVLSRASDEIRDNKKTKYDGRLWLNHKVISFWNYPENKTILFKILSDLEKKLNVDIINNNYRIETFIDNKYGDIIPIELYGEEHHLTLDRKPHELSPLKWQEIGGKKSIPYNTIYHNSKKEKGTLSKSAAEYNFKTQKGIAENNDYRGEHQAPNRDDTPMYDVTNAYGNDFYDSLQKSVRYYGNGTNYDNFSVGLIQSVHNKPNALIKIYRAVPLAITNQEKIEMLEKHKKYILKTGRLPYGVDNWNDKSEYYDFISDKLEKLKELPLDGKLKINSGDWVTINPAYAKKHGIAHLNNKYRILTKTVFAKNLFTDGNSIHEWGYVN